MVNSVLPKCYPELAAMAGICPDGPSQGIIKTRESGMADADDKLRMAERLREHASQTQIADYARAMLRAAEDLEASVRQERASLRQARRA